MREGGSGYEQLVQAQTNTASEVKQLRGELVAVRAQILRLASPTFLASRPHYRRSRRDADDDERAQCAACAPAGD